MSEILNFLFEQDSQSQTIDVILEITGVVFGLLSVWYSKNNNILVFPTGMISTSIFIYLLYKWVLLGDMLINVYYFIMSIYGWYIWTRKKNDIETPITRVSSNEKKFGLILFLSSLVLIYLVYVYFDKWGTYQVMVLNLKLGNFL